MKNSRHWILMIEMKLGQMVCEKFSWKHPSIETTHCNTSEPISRNTLESIHTKLSKTSLIQTYHFWLTRINLKKTHLRHTTHPPIGQLGVKTLQRTSATISDCRRGRGLWSPRTRTSAVNRLTAKARKECPPSTYYTTRPSMIYSRGGRFVTRVHFVLRNYRTAIKR